MTFNRSYDFEKSFYSSLASEIEQSLKSHLESKNAYPNNSEYYLDQIKESLKDISHNKNSSKMTVADMVDDLMKRTGLNNYIEKIKANAFDEQIEKNISFIDVENFKKAIDHYISQYNPSDSVSVLVSEDIKTVLESLKKDNEIPEELFDMSLDKDKKLISYIQSKVANQINSSIHQDSVYEMTSAPNSTDTSQDFGAEWNKSS